MSKGKYTDIFQSANKERSKEVKEERDIVNLCIKVDRRLRRHWQSEAKKRDTTVTAIIVDYLKQELGEPE